MHYVVELRRLGWVGGNDWAATSSVRHEPTGQGRHMYLLEGVLRRAFADTQRTIDSSLWFWGSQLLGAAVSTVWAVTLYPPDASTLVQAAIQAAVVASTVVLLALVVFVCNLATLSLLRQRNEARAAVLDRDQQITEMRAAETTRSDLVAARDALGNLMGDMGEYVGSIVRTAGWADGSHDFFDMALDILRGPNPTFDESHVGRFYAATTRAGFPREGEVPPEWAAERRLHAQIDCLERFVTEINDVLHLRHGVP